MSRAMDTWSRIAGLNRVRRGVEAARASDLGALYTHHGDGSPCCALGHGVGRVLPVSLRLDAARVLEITGSDAHAITTANDTAQPHERKRRVLACIRARIALAVAGVAS